MYQSHAIPGSPARQGRAPDHPSLRLALRKARTINSAPSHAWVRMLAASGAGDDARQNPLYVEHHTCAIWPAPSSPLHSRRRTCRLLSMAWATSAASLWGRPAAITRSTSAARCSFPHSLGFVLYRVHPVSGIPHDGRRMYKMMGLSAYGRARFRDAVPRRVRIEGVPGTSQPDYFSPTTRRRRNDLGKPASHLGAVFSRNSATYSVPPPATRDRVDRPRPRSGRLCPGPCLRSAIPLLTFYPEAVWTKRSVCLAGGVRLKLASPTACCSTGPISGTLRATSPLTDAGTSFAPPLYTWHQTL